MGLMSLLVTWGFSVCYDLIADHWSLMNIALTVFHQFTQYAYESLHTSPDFKERLAWSIILGGSLLTDEKLGFI